MSRADSTQDGPGPSLPWLIASIMVLVTLAIDVVLPALPAIGRELGIQNDNDRQWIIGAFMFGFSASQFFIGPISDRYGRRKPLLLSLSAYIALSIGAALASNLEVILALRLLQGAAGGMTRVLITAMVRDLYAGPQMARVMSLATTAFIIAPIVGPSLGAIIIYFGSWRWIFILLALVGTMAWITTYRRLPETLPQSARRPLDPKSLANSVLEVCRERQSACFTMALAFRFAGQFTFLLSIQQVFEHVWKRPDLMPIALGGIAMVIACGSFTNAQLVTRFTLFSIARTVTLALVAIAIVQLALVQADATNIWVFIGFQAAISALTAICNATFQALAMENMGKLAGTASSIQSSASMLLGTVLAGLAGQAFDGTLFPYAISLLLFAIGALTCVIVAQLGSRKTHTGPVARK